MLMTHRPPVSPGSDLRAGAGAFDGTLVKATGTRLAGSRSARAGAGSGPRSGVGIRAGIATMDADVEAAEVELPSGTVVIALPVIGQAVVAQDHAGSAAFGLKGDDHAGGPGRDGPVVCPAPGERQAVRRVDLHELAGRLHAISHDDAVAAAWHRLQHGFGAHPLDMRAGSVK